MTDKRLLKRAAISRRTLNREIFKTSRLLEFCSEKELVNQTGHSVEQWPLVILKELADNAIDACEEAGIAPVMKVTVRKGLITLFNKRQWSGHRAEDGNGPHRLLHPDFEPRGLRLADPRRPGQCAENHLGHALCAGWRHDGRDADRLEGRLPPHPV
jgi:hypothetical protein